MGAPQKIITQPGQTPPQLQGGPGQAVVDVAKVLAQMTPQAHATQRLAELQKVYPLEAILQNPQGQQLFNIAQGFSTPQQQPQYPVGVNLGKVGNVAADILTLGLGKPLQRLGAKIPKPAMEGAQPTALETLGDKFKFPTELPFGKVRTTPETTKEAMQQIGAFEKGKLSAQQKAQTALLAQSKFTDAAEQRIWTDAYTPPPEYLSLMPELQQVYLKLALEAADAAVLRYRQTQIRKSTIKQGKVTEEEKRDLLKR